MSTYTTDEWLSNSTYDINGANQTQRHPYSSRNGSSFRVLDTLEDPESCILSYRSQVTRVSSSDGPKHIRI
jgi:hypothetical protein